MSADPNRNLVIALVAENENQTLLDASQGFASGFESHGYRHRILNMNVAGNDSVLLNILKEGQVAFAYGFAGAGSQFCLSDKTNLWTAAQTPFAALWHDHPAYNYRQHIVDSPYIVHCYFIRDHLDARQKHLPASSSLSVLLTDSYWAMTHYPSSCPLINRERKILFAKTASRHNLWAEDWKRHSPSLQKILWAMVEEARKDRNIDLADTARALFAAEGISANNLDVFMGAIQEVDHYIRGWRSDRLARALLPHPAHIVGRGWEYLKEERRTAELFAPIPAHEYLNHSLNYRIVANSSPLWRDGIHERVFLGLCLGAVVLTDRTEKSDGMFEGISNFVGFEWDDNLEDVIAEAMRRGDDVDANYVSATDKVFKENMLAQFSDYLIQIEEAINKVQNHVKNIN